MSGIVGISVNKKVLGFQKKSSKEMNESFRDDLFWLTFYHQHMGQEYGGLATMASSGNILVRTHRGLFRNSFENDMQGFLASAGIGSISSGQREPYLVDKSEFPPFALCFAGNLHKKNSIIKDLLKQGHSFERWDDIVLISKLIVKNGWNKLLSVDENFARAISHMTEVVRGAYALVVLTGNKIIAVRGPDGHESLTVGVKPGAIAVASESCAFYNQGYQIDFDIKPGEMLVIQDGEICNSLDIKVNKEIATNICPFKWVYTSNPTSVIEGVCAAEVRKRIGAMLAKKDIINGFIPDIVVPVPDSGRFHAIGYKQECDRQMMAGVINKTPVYDESLVKYPYASRSYTPSDASARRREAQKKIMPIVPGKKDNGNYKGKTIVVVDDSIVRGNQIKGNLVRKLSASGVREIHFRIANPKLVAICPWGKANKKRKDLIAINHEEGRVRTEEEIAQILGVDSCRFNVAEDIAQCIGIKRDDLCLDCITF